MALIRVLVADDHELVRCGLVHMLADSNGIEVVGEACSGEEVLSFCRENSVDIVLMDIRMPGIGGLEATRRLHGSCPQSRVIALSALDDAVHSRKILEAGAWGYLTRGGDFQEMVQAVQTVYAGRRYICPNIAQEMAVQSFSQSENPFVNLSPQEFQVAMMVIDCFKTSQIAEQMKIETKTVNSYRYRIFDKLGVTNDVGLTRLAIQYGLVDVGPSQKKGPIEVVS
ncbi:response regulator [Sansalvadorimonas verongulae]|uniref:response regulator n=1 Tax=Sansalvadorimonas verongulae TaxID=2172824 RepID=UPI002E32BA4F|nr:response regulator [Sansalvadorimonas verongulae]MTI12084.1 response regulator [Sansalvadorimonas verongulae]